MVEKRADMNVFEALKIGWQKVYRFRRYVFVVYAINLLIALILGSIVSADIRASLGNSMSAAALSESFNALWYQGFSAQAQGISQTFHPSVAGIGAIFNGLDALLKGDILKGHASLFWIGLFYWSIWALFSAGFMSIYANSRANFFRSSEYFFIRFLILSTVAAIAYIFLFSIILPALNMLVKMLTRDMIDERPAFFYTLAKYLLLWLCICFINILLDYSKISVLKWNIPIKKLPKAAVAGLRFIGKQPFRVIGLYLTGGMVWLLLLATYWLVVPGGGENWWISLFFTFVLGQIYIICRIAIKCWFYASETIFYLSRVDVKPKKSPMFIKEPI